MNCFLEKKRKRKRTWFFIGFIMTQFEGLGDKNFASTTKIVRFPGQVFKQYHSNIIQATSRGSEFIEKSPRHFSFVVFLGSPEDDQRYPYLRHQFSNFPADLKSDFPECSRKN